MSEKVVEDIASLKTSQQELRRSLDEGNRAMQVALDAVNGRLETMSDLLQTVARIAERQDAHGNAVERAFGEIRAAREHADQRADEHERWQEAHLRENAAVERKLSAWHGVALGISLTSGLVVSLLAWAGNDILGGFRDDIRQIEQTSQRDDERLDHLERVEARYHSGELQ